MEISNQINRPNIAIVPCNGCVLCCKRDAVRLLPEDDPSLYKTAPHPHVEFRGHLMLDHKKNGDCVYLGDDGCTIHSFKPLMCKRMDCRSLAAKMSWTKARKKPGLLPIWRKGKDLLKAIAT